MLAVACVVVFLYLLCGWVSRFGDTGDFGERSPRAESLVRIAWRVCCSIPVLFIACRGGMSWRELGFERPRPRDGLIALILSVLVTGAGGLTWLMWCFRDLFRTGPRFDRLESLNGEPADIAADAEPMAWQLPPMDTTALGHTLNVAAEIANGFCEELSMRAYLLMRLRAATGSWSVAIRGSTAVFAASHVQYDAYGRASVFVFGLVLAAGWLITRNLWVVAAAHALGDLLITGFLQAEE